MHQKQTLRTDSSSAQGQTTSPSSVVQQATSGRTARPTSPAARRETFFGNFRQLRRTGGSLTPRQTVGRTTSDRPHVSGPLTERPPGDADRTALDGRHADTAPAGRRWPDDAGRTPGRAVSRTSGTSDRRSEGRTARPAQLSGLRVPRTQSDYALTLKRLGVGWTGGRRRVNARSDARSDRVGQTARQRDVDGVSAGRHPGGRITRQALLRPQVPRT